MSEPSIYVTDKSGPHHIVTGQPPHHEDDCTPECPLNPASVAGGCVGTFTVPPSDRIQQPVPIALLLNDGKSMDVTSAERWENPDGSVFALVAWEEWPRDGSGWGSAT